MTYTETTCTKQAVTVSVPGAPSRTIATSPTSGEFTVIDPSGLVLSVPYDVNNIDTEAPTIGSALIQGLTPGSATMLANGTVALKLAASDLKDPKVRAIC